MKKITLAAALLALAATTAEARDVAPGTIMVTGDTNLEITSSETTFDTTTGTSTEETDSTELNVGGAYFVSRNFGIGLMIGSEDSEKRTDTATEKSTLTMVGPILGYNFSFNPDASLLLTAGIFTASGDLEYGSTSADIDGSGMMFMASVVYFLNDRIAVNAGLRRVEADLDLKSGGTTTSADMTETSTTIGLMGFF